MSILLLLKNGRFLLSEIYGTSHYSEETDLSKELNLPVICDKKGISRQLNKVKVLLGVLSGWQPQARRAWGWPLTQ
jgi:hypothetical protein